MFAYLIMILLVFRKLGYRQMSPSELGFNNYTTYRCDRNSNTSNCSRGGGVLLSVNNKYYSRM